MNSPRSLEQWLSLIEQAHPQEIELGLDRVAAVARRLGIEAYPARVITVAGTNGKGSCVAVCQQLLLQAGYRVGCYTSPHLQRYNERVRINGDEVSDADLVRSFEQVAAAAGSTSLTYFEYGTLSALWLFQQAALDFWVLEVGLGGRLDAVNIIDPDVAVVTSIDIDHIDWLGSSRAGIAREKAGIFRGSRPAVSAERDAPETLAGTATAIGARFLEIGDSFDVAAADGCLTWRWLDSAGEVSSLSSGPLAGLYPDNVAAALQAVALLDALPAREDIPALLESCNAAGRRQQAEINGVEIVLDVGHNPAGTAILARWLRDLPARKTALVFAVMQDKDIPAMLEPLHGIADCWLLPSLPGQRAASPEMVRSALASLGGANGDVRMVDTVAQAMEDAMRLIGAGGRVVVCGSFFTIGPALDYLDSLGTWK